MYPEDIARGFVDRPGFNLVDFEEVGLPVYRLTTNVLTLQPNSFPPFEEFVLRSVAVGLDEVATVAGLLGVSPSMVAGLALTLCWDVDLIGHIAQIVGTV